MFAGQRFCRACGHSTDSLEMGEAPTQQMPQQRPVADEVAPTRPMPPPADWGPRGAAQTAPQSRPDTSPVGKPPAFQQPGPYQTPPTYQVPPQPPVWQPARYPVAPPPPTSSRSGSSWAIVLAIVLAILLGTIIGGRALVQRIRNRVRETVTQTARGEDVKQYPLAANATVAIRTVNGNISVQGWDQPLAEVHTITNGTLPSAVTIRNDNGSLFLEAPAGGRVNFEVKLPRQLGVVSFNSTNGTINISDVAGQLSIETTNGRIKLDGVTGIDRAKTVNGAIDATLGKSAKERPITFETVSGRIDLRVLDDFNATVDASATVGGIDISDGFPGLRAERTGPVGSRANGTIGSGGQTVTIRTVSGGIHIGK